MTNWTYVLFKLNQHRDHTQTKFTKENTGKTLYDFWVNHRKTK